MVGYGSLSVQEQATLEGKTMIPLIIAIAAITALIFLSVKIVPEYQRLVILRFGKVLDRPKGPGLVLVIPFVDRPVKVDLREKMYQVPHLTCITRDNASIAIDFLIYSRVVDPMSSVLAVQDFQTAAQGIATTTLRAVIGDIPLDDVLAKRDQINVMLQERLDAVSSEPNYGRIRLPVRSRTGHFRGQNHDPAHYRHCRHYCFDISQRKDRPGIPAVGHSSIWKGA